MSVAATLLAQTCGNPGTFFSDRRPLNSDDKPSAVITGGACSSTSEAVYGCVVKQDHALDSKNDVCLDVARFRPRPRRPTPPPLPCGLLELSRRVVNFRFGSAQCAPQRVLKRGVFKC